MERCNVCPRKCNADRKTGTGYCGEGELARVAKVVSPFEYEEPCLGTLSAVFFSGCNLHCSYCQNQAISGGGKGEVLDAKKLADLFDSTIGGIDLVTPTHFINVIENALKECKTKKKIIYNTSGYESEYGTKKACEFTDVFLTDLKYVDSELSKRFSNAPDYFEKTKKAIAIMRKNNLDEWTEENGIKTLKRGMVIRHLVLPDCVRDSKRVLDFIAGELGTDTVVSIMSQFTPNGKGEPNRKIKPIEYKIVTEYAIKLGFKNGYFQDTASANACFTPDF